MTEDLTFAALDLVFGYWKTQIVHALAALSVADILADGPASTDLLAERARASKDSMRRLMRAAVSLGLARVADGDRFASTALLETLRADVPGSVRAMAIAQASPAHWQPWGRFVEAIRSGRSQSVAALGGEHFQYFAAHPEEAATFAKAMQGTSEMVESELVRLLDCAGVGVAVDVGSSFGSLICSVVNANPGLKGIAFDLPHSLEGAKALVASRGLEGRVAAAAGDFFASLPAGDLYLLKYILHDWDDEKCLQILRNCRAAATGPRRLAIVELALGPVAEAGLGALVDLNMLVLVDGRERTAEEFGRLLAAANYKLTDVKPTRSPFVIYEAVAA
jgi:hypothetical protein